MRELRRVEKTRSDGVKQDYHVRATGLRSDRPTRDALRASRASESAVPREYAVRLRAASPNLSEADLERLHGHIPVEYAASALRRGMTVDNIIEAYQEHAPRSAGGDRPTYEPPRFIPVRQPTQAERMAAAVANLANLRKEQ